MTRTPLLQPAFTIPTSALERARSIRLLLLDVDGVLTDGRIVLGAEDEYKAFDIKDGHGLKMLQREGIEIGILTGRTSRAVERRAAELGIGRVFQGCDEKLPVCRQLIADMGLVPEQTAYAGDDLADLPVLLFAGFGVAVQDAHHLVKQHAHWVAPSRGGRGAVRELCELILYAQGKYEAALRRYLGVENVTASTHA
jgi:3-deoxy-D-manno-octulosonate 8-phosphate phosphatase (KDO 8-P phosphatase)